MDIVSVCPLRVSGFVWYPSPGACVLTVMGKATFELRPNECVLAPDQEEPSEADAHWDDDPKRSVVVPSDRAPFKPRADVVLVGHAYAPNQQPTRSIMTRLSVGEIDKSIEVWCDRSVRTTDGRALEGQRLAKMRLTWERAAGGPETNNPVGLRFDAAPDAYGIVPIPSLQPPGTHFRQWGDTFAPVGYGPIAPQWPLRAQKLHRYAATFPRQAWEKQPLPDDFDYTYFNMAPPDQQLIELSADERILLENLHPQHPRLVTRLPGIRPRAIADRATGERDEIDLAADTLWIDTDQGICTVVWRGRLRLRHPQEVGRVAFWVDKLPTSSAVRAASHGEPVISALDADKMERFAETTITLPPSMNADANQTLPFLKGAAAPPPRADVPPRSPPPWLGSLAEMPFAEMPWREDMTGTLVGNRADARRDPLPFAHQGGAPSGLPGRPVAVLMPGLEIARISGPAPITFEARAPLERPMTPSAAVERAPAESPARDVARPPLIGPLAMAEVAAEAATKPEVMPQIVELASAPQKREEAPAAAGKERRPEDVSLERCAALTAQIGRSKPEKPRILKEAELSPEQWSAVERYWSDAIKSETKKGKMALLNRFDAAYVEQLERDRGPIEVREYAMLMVAAERGMTDSVLEELGLPRGALLRIERIWMQRLASDAGLGEKVGEAVDKQRKDTEL